MLPPFRLSLLGHVSLEGADGPVDLSSKKLAGLLAYLACGVSRPHTRERLMSLLWGTHDDTQARQNLRQAMHRLRAILGKSAILNKSEEISLAPKVLVCDVGQFEAFVNEGVIRPSAPQSPSTGVPSSPTSRLRSPAGMNGSRQSGSGWSITP